MNGASGEDKTARVIELPTWTPIFPLPNAVLLPQAILPLHVFEERYRAMTRDALAGPRLIAMALLKPGHEATYHTRHAEIHDIVCVGYVYREERLPDGRYNFLLHGIMRGRVLGENTECPYRRGRLEPVLADAVGPDVEAVCRGELLSLLGESPLVEIARKARWLDVFDCQGLGLTGQLDLLASVVIQGIADRQRFLAEPDVRRRTRMLLLALRAAAVELCSRQRRLSGPRYWPRCDLPN